MGKNLRLVIMVIISIMVLAAPVTGNQTETRVSDVVDINNHWAEKQMTHLVGMGVVKGYSTTTFDPALGVRVPAKAVRPKQNITRAEFAVMMYETLNLEPVGAKAPFADYSKIPAWAQTAVNTLYEKGIMQGNNGKVNPTAYITRAEIAAMVVKGLNDKGEPKQTRTFPDLGSEHWAYKPVQKAADMGIIQGRPDGKFAPRSFATRGEVMTMLYNMLSYDRTDVPADSTLRAVSDEYMTKNSQVVNGSKPYNLNGLLPILTGHEAAAVGIHTDVLNEMASQYQEIRYEVLSEGKVVNKSDWLAEAVYKTRMTLKGNDAEQVINLEEHVYLMKMKGNWFVYYVPSNQI